MAYSDVIFLAFPVGSSGYSTPRAQSDRIRLSYFENLFYYSHRMSYAMQTSLNSTLILSNIFYIILAWFCTAR